MEEAARFPWPDPDWFDYGAIPALCAQYPDAAIAVAGSLSPNQIATLLKQLKTAAAAITDSALLI